MINAQLSTDYDSSNNLRGIFSRIIGTAPSLLSSQAVLRASWLDTPLGPMIAIANEEYLYLLEFVDRHGLERGIERLKQKTKFAIIPGETMLIESIKEELQHYFNGQLINFKTPLFLLGSSFQKQVWGALQKIPHGQTCSYADLAKAIGVPTAYRAVANANGANQHPIIIPCHRVINSDGKLGGYSSGIERKQWLLNLEKQKV